MALCFNRLSQSGHLSLIEPSIEGPRQPGQTVCSALVAETKVQLLISDNRILFEFHSKENAKKPKSVHATYVISGIQKPPEPPAANGHANDEDEVMQSSPYLPSSMPNQDAAADSLRIASIILAREEDLEGRWSPEDVLGDVSLTLWAT